MFSFSFTSTGRSRRHRTGRTGVLLVLISDLTNLMACLNRATRTRGGQGTRTRTEAGPTGPAPNPVRCPDSSIELGSIDAHRTRQIVEPIVARRRPGIDRYRLDFNQVSIWIPYPEAFLSSNLRFCHYWSLKARPLSLEIEQTSAPAKVGEVHAVPTKWEAVDAAQVSRLAGHR
jgi:hypothetical protein